MKLPTLPRLTCYVVTAVVLFVSVAPAIQPARVAAENGQAFSISPPLIELKTDPGKTVTAKIKLTNVSSSELLIKTQFNDFGAKNETGEPNIIFDTTQNTTYSLRNWITAPPPFKLASKETKSIDFPIVAPTNAEPGGHYAVIRFTGVTPGLEQSGVALSASIGTLVLLQVSGNVQQKTSITDFYSASSNLTKTVFFENGPIHFIQRIRSDGNVHVKPSGTVDVYDMFGKKVESVRVNGDPRDSKNMPKSVLPQSTRRFDQTWQKNWLLGRYEARLNLQYAQDQKPLTASFVFWVIPYKFILLMLLIIVIVFFGLRAALKKYNAYIISRAQHHSKK